tara:strand:+ start:461 stop:1195 length:735 start_codon:yes stop_codon:yes gene_type:complete
MKFLNIFDILIASFINRIENKIKYNKDFTEKYYKEDYVKESNENFKYFKEKLLYIKNIVKIKDNKIKILDIGCGTGRFFDIFYGENIFGIDINKNMLEKAYLLKKNNKSITLFNTDILNFNRFYNLKEFDFIYSIGVFGEHGLIEKESMQVIIENLKVGGYLFFTIYEEGIRRKGIIKIILIILEKFFQIIKLQKSGNYISKKNKIENIIQGIENIEIIYKIKKSTFARDWKGRHIIVLIRRTI